MSLKIHSQSLQLPVQWRLLEHGPPRFRVPNLLQNALEILPGIGDEDRGLHHTFPCEYTHTRLQLSPRETLEKDSQIPLQEFGSSIVKHVTRLKFNVYAYFGCFYEQ